MGYYKYVVFVPIVVTRLIIADLLVTDTAKFLNPVKTSWGICSHLVSFSFLLMSTRNILLVAGVGNWLLLISFTENLYLLLNVLKTATTTPQQAYTVRKT